MERTIRLRKDGEMTQVKANVTDWIDKHGRRFATAEVDGTLYDVISRDAYGPVFGCKED